MPKSKEYLSSSESDSDNTEPKQKKKKPEPEPEKKASNSASASKSAKKGSGGEYMFQLSRMRFATVSEFRGKVMVGIREYYEKDGDLLPGKKGISLSMEQWQALKDNVEEIDECVKKM